MGGRKRDKTTGLPLPNPVVPATSVCFRIAIPNALEYRTAFKGVLSELGKTWTWEQTVGSENDDARTAAELWRERIDQAFYIEECGADMSCVDVANCIDIDATVQSSITNQITNNTQNITAIQNMIAGLATPGVTATPGQPMTPAQSAAPLNPLTGCNKDEFWAQCQQFTEYFTQAGTDFLEKIATYSNAIEGAGFIEMIPVIGSIIDEAQIDKAIQFIAWGVDSVKILYDAALTNALKEEIACAYFCEGENDCVLSIDRIFAIHNNRLGGFLTPSAIDSVEELINSVTVLVTNSGNAVDAWLLTVSGIAKTLGYLGVRGIDQSLALVLKLAVNDANNDWTILCTDCPSELPIIIINPGGYPGGTWEETSPNTVVFTAAAGDGFYRMSFQYNNAARCIKTVSISTTGNPTPAYTGWYVCGANPAVNGWNTGNVSGIPVEGDDYCGLIYAHTGPFTVTVTFGPAS